MQAYGSIQQQNAAFPNYPKIEAPIQPVFVPTPKVMSLVSVQQQSIEGLLANVRPSIIAQAIFAFLSLAMGLTVTCLFPYFYSLVIAGLIATLLLFVGSILVWIVTGKVACCPNVPNVSAGYTIQCVSLGLNLIAFVLYVIASGYFFEKGMIHYCYDSCGPAIMLWILYMLAALFLIGVLVPSCIIVHRLKKVKDTLATSSASVLYV